MRVTVTVESELGDVEVTKRRDRVLTWTGGGLDDAEELQNLIQDAADQAILAYPLIKAPTEGEDA